MNFVRLFSLFICLIICNALCAIELPKKAAVSNTQSNPLTIYTARTTSCVTCVAHAKRYNGLLVKLRNLEDHLDDLDADLYDHEKILKRLEADIHELKSQTSAHENINLTKLLVASINKNKTLKHQYETELLTYKKEEKMYQAVEKKFAKSVLALNQCEASKR